MYSEFDDPCFMFPKLSYPWQQLVLDAFMELDPVSLQSKVNKAELAIRERLRAPSPTLHERTALHEALRELQLMFPQNSKQQEFGEMKAIREGRLPRTRASSAKSRAVDQLPTSETAKVLHISSSSTKERIPRAYSELKRRRRSGRSAR